jgi:hypothetical protein
MEIVKQMWYYESVRDSEERNYRFIYVYIQGNNKIVNGLRYRLYQLKMISTVVEILKRKEI